MLTSESQAEVPAPSLAERRKRGAAATRARAVEQDRQLRQLRLHQRELEAQNRQLREAQAALEQSRASYVELYDSAPVGYATLDRDATIYRMNLTGAGLLGAERFEVLGRPLHVFLARESRRTLDRHLGRCLAENSQLVTELRMKDGRRTLEITSSPAVSRERRPGLDTNLHGMTHAILVDISERKRAEAERADLLERERRARAAAEASNRAREEFLAVISHELRTPLAPMTTWLGVLRRAVVDRDAVSQADALEALDQCLRAQTKVTDDLLDLARGKAGKLSIERRPIDLASLVQSMLDTLKPVIRASGIDVRVVIEPAGPRPIMGDAARLQQVVGVLMSNALKFTPEGGFITVRLERDGSDEVLVVDDDGQGIEPGFLAHVFEPFRQQDSGVARRQGGLGLGLSIASQLVTLHGGTIHAASTGPGRGARFTVTLPGRSAAPAARP
jgi:PAS domain S-box-containing protein